MGNETSHNNGFYTPSGTPDIYNNDNVKIQANESTCFNVDINDMLSEIAAEIDKEYDNNNKSIAKQTEVDKSVENKKIDWSVSLSFVPQQNHVRKISEIFTYKKQLGSGASCRVLLVEDKNKNEYALKEMQKHNHMNRLLFVTEYKILNKLNGHENILNCHSSFMDKNCYYLCTAYHSGGTMLDRILEKGSFCESECAEFIKNVLHGLKYMHLNNIAHRDIKCENLIFDKKGKDGIVKIIDFGNSEIITNPKEIDNKIVGSLHYLPPELLSAEKRSKQMLYKGDMWAIGVVCYILVTGKVPFYGRNQLETLECIRKGKFIWPKKEEINLSDSCKDFISLLLNMDVNKRLNCDSALKHEWISTKGKALDILFGDQYLDQIEIFSKTNKLQKILVNAVLSEMNKKEKNILLKALRDLNMNANNIDINQNHIINYVLMHDQINKPQTTHAQTNNLNTITDIDIEHILSEIDELDKMDAMNKNKNNSFAMINEEESDEEPFSADDQFEREQIDIIKLSFFDFSSAQSMDSDIEEDNSNYYNNANSSQTKISVQRFSEIIESAEKEYDIGSLIHRLKPTDSGHIPLKNITGFNGALHSKSSNNKMMHDKMQIELNAIDESADENHDFNH